MKQCKDIQRLLSSYLDGATEGAEAHQVSDHLRECSGCGQEYQSLQTTQVLVSSAGKRQPPPDLALRVRVAVARERARAAYPWWQILLVRSENVFNTFMLPATTGIISATIVFFALGGFMAMPEAGNRDVPTEMLYTPPRLLTANSIPTNELPVSFDSPVVVEALVGPDGRVEDYRILAGPRTTPELRKEVENALIFTQFEPAKSLGQPSSGKVVISFSREQQVYTEQPSVSVRVRG